MIGRRKKSRGIKTRMRKPKKNFLLVTRAPLRLFQGSSGEKRSRPYVAYVPPPRRTRYRSRDHLYGSSELVSLLFLLPRVEVHEEAGRSKRGEGIKIQHKLYIRRPLIRTHVLLAYLSQVLERRSEH